jgi:hypothetical protein
MLTPKKSAIAPRTLKLSKFRRKGRTEAEAFEAAIREANDKDHLILFTCRWYMAKVTEWGAHSHGVAIRQGARTFSLNGVEPKKYMSDGNSDSDHPREGRVFMNPVPRDLGTDDDEYMFLLNGRTLYCGQCDAWKTHRHGVLLRIGEEFLLVVAKAFDPDAVIC